jgi:CubicO group peptidase (beta-lactamase class C family)
MLSLLLVLTLQTAAPVAPVPGQDAVPPIVADVAAMVLAEAGPQAPAISFAIRDGEEIYAFAWGVQRETTGEEALPATTKTRFRIASISKPLTAIGAALLWQRDQLDLDADIRLLVPEFAEKKWKLTARLLGAHLSGLRHYDGYSTPSESANDVIAEVADYGDDPLYAEPGTKYHYSTFGFNLLGAVVQRAADQEFRAFLEEQVFAPLGMEDTIAEVHDTKLGEIAALYQTIPATKVRVEVPRNDIGYKWPGGGFLSTATDLVKMTSAVCDDRLLGAEARTLMQTRAQMNSGETVSYSFGWNVGGGDKGPLRMSHGGAQLGARSFVLVYPEQDLALAILANHSGAQIGDGKLLRRAAKMLLETRALATEENEETP